MALDYKQYTSCVKAADHLDLNQYVRIFLETAAAGVIGGLIVAASGMPWCLLFVLPIMIMQGTLAYCHWWLEDRLVCLGGDQSVVGMLVSIETPEGKPDFFDKWDTDYSINLLPASNPIGADQAAVEVSVPYGVLVHEHASTKAEGLPWAPELVLDEASGKKSAVLHAEFEGAGVADVLLGAQIGLGLSVAALIACMAIPFPWGLIVAAILAVLAFLAWLIGLIVGRGDTGSATDVNPALADLHTNSKDASGRAIGAHILFVVGRWVFDTGHNNQGKGWNELHPVKYCTIVGIWDGQGWPANIDALIADANDQYGKTSATLTTANQHEPQHQWEVHPLIDGCEPAAGGDPIR